MALTPRMVRRPALDLDRMAKMAREHVVADAACVYVSQGVPPFAASVRGDNVPDADWFESLVEHVVTLGRAPGLSRAPLYTRGQTFVIALSMPDGSFIGALGVGSRRVREWSRDRKSTRLNSSH